MNIDEAIEILNNTKREIKTWLGYRDENTKKKVIEEKTKKWQAIEVIISEYDKERENINKVLGLIFEYGQIDGDHHKAWVIDQIVRALTEDDYDKWVENYEYDEETGDEYEWDIGIAP